MNSFFKIEAYSGLPCTLKEFTIKGAAANTMDFGAGRDAREGLNLFNYDMDTVNYGCCNYIFECDPDLKEYAMTKYNLTESEYDIICDQLSSTLSIGECGWCI